MAYTVVITTNARRDIQDAIDWENMRKPGLGSYFLKDLDQKILAISKNPYISSVRFENTQCAATNIFSYLIYYTTDDAKEQVLISRVLHTSRRPIW